MLAEHAGSLSACTSYEILLLLMPNHMLVASLGILQSYGISLQNKSNENNALHKLVTLKYHSVRELCLIYQLEKIRNTLLPVCIESCGQAACCCA